jgi:hypothetical protein
MRLIGLQVQFLEAEVESCLEALGQREIVEALADGADIASYSLFEVLPELL